MNKRRKEGKEREGEEKTQIMVRIHLRRGQPSEKGLRRSH